MSQRARSDELSALTSIAAQVNCTQDLNEILAGALETTLNVIGEESGEIFLLDQETGDLVLHTHRGVSPTFAAEESLIPSDQCLCGQAVGARRILVSSDLEHDPARARGACLRHGFTTCVRLPLMARGHVLGLLTIQSRDRRDISQADHELLTAIGNQIGIAIANAQLIQDAEERRATLDSVMNSLVDGLILIDRHDRVTYVNPHAQEILALPAGAVAGPKLDDLHREIAAQAANPQATLEQLRQAATCRQDTASATIVFDEPTRRTLQARYFLIHHADEPPRGLGLILRDVTREREIDEMKSRLLSTVSHELRTPLASIKGFATTLLRRDVEWDDASRRDFLSIIDQESDRLAELIGNLLDMSRIEAGELAVAPEPVDLVPMLREMAATLQPISGSHQLELDLAEPLPFVLADARRTRQVMRNLIENAIKYSPEGGPVLLTAHADDHYVQIGVADKGLGIEPQQLERIFDRFYQIDSASTRRVGGTGLGLSISQAIVEAQGGTIWAQSQLGAGTTFYFTIPRADSPPANSP